MISIFNGIVSVLLVFSLCIIPKCIVNSFRGQVICAITGHKDGYIKKFDCIIKGVFLFVLRFNVQVNKFSVMSGWSHRFLGITSTFGE